MITELRPVTTRERFRECVPHLLLRLAVAVVWYRRLPNTCVVWPGCIPRIGRKNRADVDKPRIEIYCIFGTYVCSAMVVVFGEVVVVVQSDSPSTAISPYADSPAFHTHTFCWQQRRRPPLVPTVFDAITCWRTQPIKIYNASELTLVATPDGPNTAGALFALRRWVVVVVRERAERARAPKRAENVFRFYCVCCVCVCATSVPFAYLCDAISMLRLVAGRTTTTRPHRVCGCFIGVPVCVCACVLM